MSTLLPSIKSQLTYLQQFIVSPRTVGTLAPSSPWLCQSMLAQVDWGNTPMTIAELGAANGVLTKRILSCMKPSDSLLAYEIQSNFIQQLNKIDDGRLRVMAHSAELLEDDFNVIFSCLPLLSLPTKVSLRILQQAKKRLINNNGILILFQYTNMSERLLSRYFSWQKIWVMRNFPPAQVYICHPL